MTDDRRLDRWVLRPRRRPDARLRLYCLPYAGGGASTYYTWANLVPSDIEICSIQLPGRENRLTEPPYRDAAALARELIHVLTPTLHRQYAIYGHSMGALVGFEMARQAAITAMPMPTRLFVGGSRPPSNPNRHPPLRNATDADILAEVHRLGGTPQAVLESQELMALALPMLRADFSVHETYRREGIIDTPITAFCGTADADVTASEMSGWARHTSRDFQLHQLPGDHFFLRTSRDEQLALMITDLDPAGTSQQ